MKKFIYIIVALLTVAGLSFSLASCSVENDREYDAAEVSAAAKVLIEKSAILNEIYFGKGIPTEKNPEGSAETYLRANNLWLNEHGFETLDDIKKMTTEVYTEGYSNDIFAATLTSAMDANDQVSEFARYIQRYDGNDKNGDPIGIDVNVKWEIKYHDDVEYLLDTLTVSGVKGQKVYVTLDANVTNDDGQTQKRTITVGLIEEENGWRLDEPTYLKFSHI